MPKYFHVEQVNRRVGGILATLYDVVGGCPMGIYKAEAENEIEALTNETKNPASGVTEISQADYESMFSKKKASLTGSEHWKANSVGPGMAIKGDGRAIVVDKPVPTKPAAKEMTVDEALAVQEVPIRQETILAKPVARK